MLRGWGVCRWNDAIKRTHAFIRSYSDSVLCYCLLSHFIAAFMCHHNTFLVYQSMRNASLERWEKVTHISIGFAWVVAALFGIAGYATFRALSQGTSHRKLWIMSFWVRILHIRYRRVFWFSGDLLENYCWEDDLMNFSRVLFSISILLTFPIECFVSREVNILFVQYSLRSPPTLNHFSFSRRE